MQMLHIKIGDHHFKVISPYKHLLDRYRNDYETLPRHLIVKSDMVIYLESGYGTSFLDYEVETFSEKGRVCFRRADYQIIVDSKYKRAKVYVHDDLAWKHAMMNLYSSFIVHNNWGLLIHSSAVVNRGNAVVFAGHSGAGKSTSALLSRPREILSDEATIVKIEEGKVTAYHSPFRSELQSDILTDSFRISGVYLLLQSQDIRTHPLKKADALIILMDKIFFWSKDEQETKKVVSMLKSLVNLTPVHHLYFQKNNKFWELIS